MLKWAVNGTRQSYLPATEDASIGILQTDAVANHDLNDITLQPDTSATDRRKLKRKSSDFYLARRLTHWLEKENQMTSTPLHSTVRCASHSPLRKLDSLKDLSNIVPESRATTPGHTAAKPRARLSTPEPAVRNNPQNYAATLPSFDVEYSPCGLVPGPILALRGLGVADAYFEQPRYFPPHTQRQQAPPCTGSSSSSVRSSQPAAARQGSGCLRDEAGSLSSSRMGDLTLERMIDSILESTRKEKKLPKSAKQPACGQRPAMSPTYTAAEDPASDLHEFWDARRNELLHRQRQQQRRRRRSLPTKMTQAYNEREVCSPVVASGRLQQESCNFHLRRQRAVRRKRKLDKSAASGRHLRQPPAGVAEVETEALAMQLPLATESGCVDTVKRQERNATAVDNTSPDSGHNSASEVDDSTLEGSYCLRGELQLNETKALDATKRRLSFSNKLLNFS